MVSVGALEDKDGCLISVGQSRGRREAENAEAESY